MGETKGELVGGHTSSIKPSSNPWESDFPLEEKWVGIGFQNQEIQLSL